MTTATFAWYIREELAPRLHAGQVVVLDNLRAQKAASIRQHPQDHRVTRL